MLRCSAYWCERPELFAAIADGKTEQARALAVLKWFIVSRETSRLFIVPFICMVVRVRLKDNTHPGTNRWDLRRSV